MANTQFLDRIIDAVQNDTLTDEMVLRVDECRVESTNDANS